MKEYIPETIEGMQSFEEVKKSIQNLAKGFKDSSNTSVNKMRLLSLRTLLDLYEKYNDMIIMHDNENINYGQLLKDAQQGGTEITNFLLKDLHLYQKAIKQYGDDNLFLGDPMPPLTNKNALALHIKNDTRDLSDFWKIFHKLRKEEQK